MKRYELASVRDLWSITVELTSTDPKLVTWFLSELKRISPNYELVEHFDSERGTIRRDLDGKIFYASVKKLDNKDGAINCWLLRELLKQGWEPFSVTPDPHGTSGEIYLRKETSD